jgi:predicted ribosome quality control (RQC) complex YloA/Tae2 family protein
MKSYTIEYELEEYDVWVGENATDNFQIISDADQNDLWFHLDQFSSPHVILRNPNNLKRNKIPKQLINSAAELCKLHSRFKTVSKKIGIIYTEVKNVKKTKVVGQVVTRKTTKIMI